MKKNKAHNVHTNG